MPAPVQHSASGPRDEWLALLDTYEVGHPRALRVVELPVGLVQATSGEPSGRIVLDPAPAHVLMFNMSPVQALRQARGGRSFVSDVLQGEMTLMPRGVPSEWSWNSTCDRLDVLIPTNVLGDGNELEVMDRFVFRDPEIEAICRHVYCELSSNREIETLALESLVFELARLLLRRHSPASGAARVTPSGGLTRRQGRRVLDYIEENLSRPLKLAELARVADLSLHHFAHVFKQTLRLSPHRYVMERRLERARQLLRTSNASLVDIGISTGFYSQSHFTSTFRRMVGATPAEFQRCFRARNQ